MNSEPTRSIMTEYGISVNNKAGSIHKKLLLSGLGRSGTSAIASIFKNVGYYVGDVSKVTTNEDKDLQGLLKKVLYADIIAELGIRAEKYSLIAWKDPKLIGQSGLQLIKMLPNDWSVVLTSRDPLAIAMRLATQHGDDILNHLEQVYSAQTKLLTAINSIAPKSVFVMSYEKFIANPAMTIMGLLADINPDLLGNIDIYKVINNAMADKKKYLEHSESVKHR